MRFGFSTAGESHGPAEVALVHGVPAGLRLIAGDVNRDLSRRQKGYGRGGRQKIERDEVEFLGGVRHGYTLGSPVAMLIRNRDYANWEHRMTPEPVEDPPQKITLPRPGHADLAGMQKYDFDDLRNVLERSSARETTARVAAGGVAKKLLAEFGVEIESAVYRIGAVAYPKERAALDAATSDSSEVRCPDPDVSEKMKAEIDAARYARDALGGEFVVVARGCPAGLGSYVDWRDKLDARLAAAMMSINAIKGVEFGMGFELAARRSSEVQDEIRPRERTSRPQQQPPRGTRRRDDERGAGRDRRGDEAHLHYRQSPPYGRPGHGRTHSGIQGARRLLRGTRRSGDRGVHGRDRARGGFPREVRHGQHDRHPSRLRRLHRTPKEHGEEALEHGRFRGHRRVHG